MDEWLKECHRLAASCRFIYYAAKPPLELDLPGSRVLYPLTPSLLLVECVKPTIRTIVVVVVVPLPPLPPRRNPHDAPPRNFLLVRFWNRKWPSSVVSAPSRLFASTDPGFCPVPKGWFAMCPCIRMIDVTHVANFFWGGSHGLSHPVSGLPNSLPTASSRPLPCVSGCTVSLACRMPGRARPGRRELREARSKGDGTFA
ncbi:hypothetical protein CGRA01v4_11468 [Colletotrichum graminicola]|nr:hypothetical protein CGRA01v4_11468 [Colletotrichum graminicola]